MRYLHISYNFIIKDTHEHGFGATIISCKQFPTHKEMTESCRADFVSKNSSIVILFWVELTEDDFIAFKQTLDEPTGNSPVDDGTGIPSSNQGKLQSDSEVQQGDKGQGSGSSDDRAEPGSDGERTPNKQIRTRPNQDS